MALSLAEAERLRASYIGAYEAFASGAQSYTVGDRTLNRGDLAKVASEFRKLDAYVDALKCGRRPGVIFRRIVPVDR